MSTTLVILFFNTIKDRIDDTGSLSKYWDVPVAHIKNPLVVFGDQEYIEFIKKNRPSELPTEYNPMRIEDLHFYDYYGKIEENRLRSWPSRDSRAPTSVHIIQANKIILLNSVAQRNPFNTQHFAYMDNNLMTRMRLTTDIVEDRLNRMKDTFHIMLLGVVNPNMTYEQIYQTYRYHLVGGFTGGDAKHCQLVCDLFKDEFIRTVEAGYGHGEEMIYIKIVYSNWNLFTVSYGDYTECVRNIHEIVQNHGYIFQMCVMKYSDAGMYPQLEHCCDKMLECKNLSGDLKIKCLYYKYIANYWLANPLVIFETLDKIKNLISTNLTARKVFLDNKEFYLTNIGYCSRYGPVPNILPSGFTLAYITNVITLQDMIKLDGYDQVIVLSNRLIGLEEYNVPKNTMIISTMGTRIDNESLIIYLSTTSNILFINSINDIQEPIQHDEDIMLYSNGSYSVRKDSYTKLDNKRNILSQLYEGKVKIRTQ